MTDQPSLLLALGRRVRALRVAAGLSAAELARLAGLSRRYVTETEAGRANPTVGVLARLGEALGMGLPELLDLDLRVREPERVALVGLRGAGKSTVGRHLALALEAPFRELDEAVEHLAGLDLAQIFALHGSDGFHRFEAEALERLLAGGERAVLAVGGSIVEAPATFQRLLDTCRTVWLRAQPEEHLLRVLGQGDERPVRGRPRAMAELRALLARRELTYARCEFGVHTTGREARDVAAEILALLQEPAPNSGNRG